MTEPGENEESITISGTYANGRCDHISVYFNHPGVTREDIAAIIDAVVNGVARPYERSIDNGITPDMIKDVEQWNLNTRKWFGINE